MDRSELTITVLGLVATFCLPWPGAGQGPQRDLWAEQRPVACDYAAPSEQGPIAELSPAVALAAQPER